MTGRVVLHIGSPKCGSTYLQRVMLQNRDMLAARGVLYPHSGAGHPGNAAEIATIRRRMLTGYFEDGDVHTVVLSHETLYSRPLEGNCLSRLAREEGIDVQVVAFLRPFSEFVFGDYSQFMKQNFDHYLATRNPYRGLSFRAFALRRVASLDPEEFLRNWQKRFAAAPIVLAGHREIRPVLTRLLGDAATGMRWEVPAHRTNPSLRIEDCQQLAALMRDPSVPAEEIRRIYLDAYHHTGEPDRGRGPGRTKMIEAAFAERNRALMDTFGYDNRRPDAQDAGDAT